MDTLPNYIKINSITTHTTIYSILLIFSSIKLFNSKLLMIHLFFFLATSMMKGVGFLMMTSMVILIIVMSGCNVMGAEIFESFPLVKFNTPGQDPVNRKSSLHFTATSFHNSYNDAISRSKTVVLPYDVSDSPPF